MTALTDLLGTLRAAAVTNRESGTYFEELTVKFLQNEPRYRDLYQEVWTYSEWAELKGLDKRDTGIDLVAETFTSEVHAIQCKHYEEGHRVQKKDIDSFFTASGKKPFSRRVIVTTTNLWSEHAEAALQDQHQTVSKIDLAALEESALDWSQYAPGEPAVLKPRKTLRPHQSDAIASVSAGLAENDRGKLIMACGTGKTFTSLKIAESEAGAGKRVLFLVPSLSLLSQTLTEWTQESDVPLHCFAVCSDTDVGKRRRKNDDVIQTFTHELRYPATTDPARLAQKMTERHDDDHMSVIFGTYHSIAVVHQAQQEHGLGDIDLVICDEAHRTTGATFAGEDESKFVLIHDAKYVRASKRLYMTATPRIYGNKAKATAELDNVVLCSMDDELLYGPRLYVLTFSEAVKRDLLVDYKVLVLAVEESHVNRRLQKLLRDDNNQLRVDDASKIIGCWKALAKQGLAENLPNDAHPMRRAVAFCQVIDPPKKSKKHRVSSTHITEMFQAVVEAYQENEEDLVSPLRCEAEHIDGTMNASKKEAKLTWLKEDTPENTCRILSNVRCLSEGVDVPALDAVLFLTPRNSQVDVVQSVGRVMRKSPGKTRGYIVLPVVIPAGVPPHEALNDNQTYRVVWQVLQALRSHDDRFDAMVNKLDLIGKDPSKMEVIAITDKLRKPSRKASPADAAKGGQTIGSPPPALPKQRELEFEIGEIERAIYVKLVQKVGNRHHWEDWAKDIARIAQTHIDVIRSILDEPGNAKERAAFHSFAEELRDDLNDSISDDEIVEMLAQHQVTRPVFDALFAGHGFASQNAMSQAMQGVLDVLQAHHIDKEASTLKAFYESVKMRAEGIDSAEGKQRIIVELYDKFFRNAFPQMSARLGIVYTPVEIVDFILHSVNDLLGSEFGQTLGSKEVHIIDPFTGTGTFISRLIQSGLIAKDELPHKYQHEIHANEIVLLAYYIAAINIEAAYQGVVGGTYQPFNGICLTDTFQMYEKDDLISRVLEENSERRKRQKKLDIRVIVGNPPYSVGQASQNDNNQNVAYPSLDGRIAETYAARSDAVLKNALYDSYIRAIRWASDRVGKSGIIGFVTNANFVEASSAAGVRRCLAEEFSSLYIFHLRGNQRTAGERSRREGGKVFGSGSRAPVAISLLVKNPSAQEQGRVYFRDIGDYLRREDKLETLVKYGSIAGITAEQGWTHIEPDEHGDWLRQRDEGFGRFLLLGDKRARERTLFVEYSNGIKTQRDAWAYSPSRRRAGEQVTQMIDSYNGELVRFNAAHAGLDTSARKARVNDFIDTDPTKISWTRGLKGSIAKNIPLEFDPTRLTPSLYRPFTKQWLYFDRSLNEEVGQMPALFPEAGAENRAIGVSGSESRAGYSVLMVGAVPSLHTVDMVGSQFFPLHLFGDDSGPKLTGNLRSSQSELFTSPMKPQHDGGRLDGITKTGLAHFREAFASEQIHPADVFYYVYGILHSPDYLSSYADNLGKELPRIPRVRSAEDFWAFSSAGRRLGDLHVGYESVPEHPCPLDVSSKSSGAAKQYGLQKTGAAKLIVKAKTDAAVSAQRLLSGKETAGRTRAEAELNAFHYRVEKMSFGKKKRASGGTEKDRSVIRYNAFITVRDIPPEAYEYVVNGKSAIEWVMDRQRVKTDKKSGIVSDANDWAIETAHDPRYPLSLLLRVIRVSLETVTIVNSLPKLDIRQDD